MTPGPPPKPPHLRRNRSAKRGGEWVELPAELEKPILGPLPRRCNGEGTWSERTRSMWAAWRADPATAMWGPADRSFALETAYLVEENVREPRASLAAEIRIRMDNLGLTARGKRALRWRVADEGEVVEHPTARAPLVQRRTRRLRAVDPNPPRGSA
jgi:hypothetical protein